MLHAVRPLRVYPQDIVHKDDAVFLDLVQHCLCVDPAKRITARKAVNHVFFTAARGYRKPPQPAVTMSPERQAAFDDLEDAAVTLVECHAGGPPPSFPPPNPA